MPRVDLAFRAVVSPHSYRHRSTETGIDVEIRENAGAHRVRVVDHREIFTGYEKHLPALNSRANISALWRNFDLAEHFVYFNDDFIVLRHVSPQDFFRGNAVVMRGNWSPQSGYSWSRRVIDRLKNLRRSVEKRDRAGNHATQELSAKRAGFERRYYRLYHNSFPMRRSTLPPPCGGRENWPDPRLAGEEKIGLIPTLRGKGELG